MTNGGPPQVGYLLDAQDRCCRFRTAVNGEPQEMIVPWAVVKQAAAGILRYEGTEELKDAGFRAAPRGPTG